ncbi:sigma-54-dependent Fis family transcriptional regulator [Dyella sp. C11]|uniref:sigma-54-dependent Fis family transcriptional regulator n=1 Tax=Dyella sp. C11 TaxID=2126991 RepID=UPI000D65CB75|nr:sigma-54-dependent Fis family transcriptional regulator [Dyella sp. C11]
MQSVRSQRRVGEARREFFEGGRVPSGQLSDTILRSWRRCRGLGLEEAAHPQVEPVPQGELRQMRERHETLWRMARAELDLLAPDAASTGSIVILTDEQGWILDAEGNPRFLDKAGRVALMPGACWSEAHVGTNAIGTAIVEGASVEVLGGEHYFVPHGILSCSSVPIFDPYGKLAGVLDISGDANVPHVHALALARMAVTHIEHRYFDAGIEDAELLRLHADPALLGTAGEGLLAFRRGRLAAANQAGLRLLGLDRGDIGHVAYDALFAESLNRLRRDGVLVDRHGQALHGRVDHAGDPSRRLAATRRAAAAPAMASQVETALFDAHLDAELERARRVLDANLPVLLQGETGSGKEMFARELHKRSARTNKPFVAINCAALPEGLIEAELFGYEEGAFTGARRTGSTGLLRQADGGVLFLDEIGDMPLSLQPRLLRVLQEREMSPLGGGKPVKLDFVLVCATHCDLGVAMHEGRFRSDLYYRIAHYVVPMPLVRDHPDRVMLVQALWSRLGQGRQLSLSTLTALAAYDWPGNMRQLVACLRTLVALHDEGDVVEASALPSYMSTLSTAPSTKPEALHASGALHDITDRAMRQALHDCAGNVSRAAKQLGVNRSTLYRRLQSRAEHGNDA